jgi:hypothetical protein
MLIPRFYMKVYDSLQNRLVEADIFQAVDRILKFSKTKTQWETIAEIIKIWENTQPTNWKSHLVDVGDIRESRKNKFAATKDKSIRYLADIPEKVLLLIRIVYPVEVLPMDKTFFRTFAKRFPQYAVPQKQ